MKCKNLILILGDQLDRESAAVAAASKRDDILILIESRNESRRIWSHKTRTSLFLAAMRHHAAWLKAQGYRVEYIRLDSPEADSFASALRAAVERYAPEKLLMVEAGEYGVQQEIDGVCSKTNLQLECFADTHFICSRKDFAAWRGSRKTMVMEHFYRHMRKKHDVLMRDGGPEGESWNFDTQNRKPFGKKGPGQLPDIPHYPPDDITQEVITDVDKLFPDNPGKTENFGWPVTREQALHMLHDFIQKRLEGFGPFQDAMWSGAPILHHSLISAALNIKLLNPREVIKAAVEAYENGHATIQSTEGFVRQILGWREYIRGVYWSEMPGYTEQNALHADQPLPGFYWNADTDMQCLRQVIQQTLDIGYAHHIQRLMVTGLFALLLGVRPREIHEWYLAVYVDAVEWVEAPNTIGMSQHADGGLLASKPYAASGRYIKKMSNYCKGCRYKPEESTGDSACPFSTLYWDFLIRHQGRFSKHPRAAMQWRMLEKLDDDKKDEIISQSNRIREQIGFALKDNEVQGDLFQSEKPAN